MSRRFVEEVYVEEDEDEPDPRAPARGCLFGLLIIYVAVALALAAWRFWPT